jgi:hypothetical protein
MRTKQFNGKHQELSSTDATSLQILIQIYLRLVDFRYIIGTPA